MMKRITLVLLNLETPWDEENFADIREPLYLSDYVPHGHLAIQHILLILTMH